MTHTPPHPPTCCCLQWISDASPLTRQQDIHMDAAGEEQGGRGGGAVCEIDQDAADIIYR